MHPLIFIVLGLFNLVLSYFNYQLSAGPTGTFWLNFVVGIFAIAYGLGKWCWANGKYR